MRERSNLFCRFHGHLGAEQCDSLIAQSQLLLVPSCWPEPFGLVGLEAARLGLPAVAFDVGGIRDWLVDGETGVLVQQGPRAAERFAEAIVACVASPVRLRGMGARARALAARFSVARHVAQLETVLASACPDHASTEA
jgi:glycosyltransferase involved in cell wall biosynthesis